MNGRVVRFVLVCASSLLSGWLITSVANAACSVVSSPGTVKSQGYLGGAIGGRGKLRVDPMTTQFAFKCDTDTSYTLIPTGLQNGVVMLQNGTSTSIALLPRLLTVDGKKVNQLFKDISPRGYQDRASADKVIVVTLDFFLAPSALQGGIPAGTFIGNLPVSINY